MRRLRGLVTQLAIAASIQGATSAWEVTAKGPRLGTIRIEPPQVETCQEGSSKRWAQSPGGPASP